jgi:hypothetical protein
VVSSAVLETLLARLPAEERARLTWTAGEIRAELSRFYESEPTRDFIVVASTALLMKLRKVQERVESWMRDGEGVVLDLDALVGAELERLRAYVEPDAASAADWVWYGAVRPLQAWVNTLSLDEATATELRAAWQNADETELHGVLDAPEGGLLRSQCLLLVAFEGAYRQLDVARATELAYLAFDHACEGVDAFAAQGIRLSDYVVDKAEERVKRTIRSAEALRTVLTTQDLEALRAARAGSLR